ncbi:MAG: hypothetical protein GX050_10700 [Firmicutes bacterium]|nr:hypothetical protein [Bacillota bacterium]
MKRIIASLAVLLMLTIATPVVAANMDFSGKVETEVAYGEEFSGLYDFNLSASLGQNLKAGMSFGSEEDVPFPWNEYNVGIKGLWLESNGALIPGTPEFVTRIGTLNANYSDFIAKSIKTTGISVDQFSMGPVTLGGYYSLNSDSHLDRGAYLKVTPVDGIEAQGTIVKANEELSYAVEATVRPLEQAEITGAFAAVDQGAQAYRVNGSYELLEGVQVRAGYQDIPTGFAPAHINTDTDVIAKGTGFTTGATVNRFGFEVKGDYADYNKTIDYSIGRTLTLAGLDFDTKLEGDFNVETTDVGELEASVAYNAPNGLELAVGYDLINNQPSVSAGMNLQF